MNFVRVYDAQSRAREKLFDWIRPLSQEQYVQAFPFGLHTLQMTMIELAGTELYHTMRIRGERFPEPHDWERWPISQATCPTSAALEAAWRRQMPQTRATLAAITEPARVMETRLVLPDGEVRILRARQGDLAAQVLLYEVHHRAQAMAMLRQFGIAAQDLDFIDYIQENGPAEGGAGA